MKLLDAGASPRGWSRLSTVLQCPQKFAYRYLLPEEQGGGKTGGNSPALIKGSIIHLGLAHYYRRMQAQQEGTPIDEWLEPNDAMRMLCLKEGDMWMEHLKDCIECVDAYIDHWQHDGFKVVAVEEMIYTHIDDHLVTGRVDLAIEDSAGKVFFVDHKTTGRINAAQKKYYSISGQLIGYEYMGRQVFGERFGGMILNQVQHKPPHKFLRLNLPPAPEMLLRFPQVVKDAEATIKRLEGRPVDQYPMAMNELTCFHRYGSCAYLEKCKWGLGVIEK